MIDRDCCFRCLSVCLINRLSAGDFQTDFIVYQQQNTIICDYLVDTHNTDNDNEEEVADPEVTD